MTDEQKRQAPAQPNPGGPVFEVKRLEMTSALELAARNGARIYQSRMSTGAPELKVALLHEVLYVPSALSTGQSLQLLRSHHLPVEAVIDDFIAGFVKRRMLDAGIEQVSGFTEHPSSRPVCILGNVFSRNFTHWHEELMKVLVIEQAGLECDFVVSELPAFAGELLTRIGIGKERVLEIRAPTRFPKVLFTEPVSYRNVSDHPAVLLALRERLLNSIPDNAEPTPERLWLDRGQQTRLGRKLVNDEEVYRLIEDHGFQRFDMGAETLERQMMLARNAQVIAGLHGSHFVHTQLMAFRSAVIECFSPLYLNPTYTEIYRVMAHRYALLAPTHSPIFPYAHGGDVLVDIQQLALALQNLEGA